jgi:SAM-dependent methyltransferase
VTEVDHPIFSRVLARSMAGAEERGNADHRREVLAGLTGRVIEIGAGTGLNFRHYPQSVTELAATEPEPHLRGIAARAAAKASVPVRVVDWVAERLDAEDQAFDAGVASLVLCSVRDPAKALRELYRVIRLGGELRYYEHVLADTPRLARMQRAVDRFGLPHLVGGDHVSRETGKLIREAGFEVQDERRFRFRPQPLNVLFEPHILGRARRSPDND